MARNFMSAETAYGKRVLLFDDWSPDTLSTPDGFPEGPKEQIESYHEFAPGFILIACIVTVVVILAVLQRLYVHKYHFTPPYLRAYQQLMAARGLVQNGAYEFGDQRQLGPFRSVPPGPEREEGGGGCSGGSGGSEMELLPERVHLSSEVLARLEQDLRATSLRERERLAAALGADLPSGRSILFPIRCQSSRTMLPPEFDLWLNGASRAQIRDINRGTQSAPGSSRFSHGALLRATESSPSTSDAAGRAIASSSYRWTVSPPSHTFLNAPNASSFTRLA